MTEQYHFLQSKMIDDCRNVRGLMFDFPSGQRRAALAAAPKAYNYCPFRKMLLDILSNILSGIDHAWDYYNRSSSNRSIVFDTMNRDSVIIDHIFYFFHTRVLALHWFKCKSLR